MVIGQPFPYRFRLIVVALIQFTAAEIADTFLFGLNILQMIDPSAFTSDDPAAQPCDNNFVISLEIYY